MVALKISFAKVSLILKFLHMEISLNDIFKPKHIKLHFPGLRAM